MVGSREQETLPASKSKNLVETREDEDKENHSSQSSRAKLDKKKELSLETR